MSIRKASDAAALRAINGKPLHRSTTIAVSGTPKDNTNSAAGGSVTYTFKGGELVMLQGDIAFYFEVNTSGNMTAAGAKGVKVEAGEKVFVLLGSADTAIAIDAVTASTTATVKMFEMQ